METLHRRKLPQIHQTSNSQNNMHFSIKNIRDSNNNKREKIIGKNNLTLEVLSLPRDKLVFK
jgi:hypothetical protein